MPAAQRIVWTLGWRRAPAFILIGIAAFGVATIGYTKAMARAAKEGVDAGGSIMIHGLPNGWGFLGTWHLAWDWTNGCIAVTNTEMRDIWALVPNGTPIEIVEVK